MQVNFGGYGNDEFMNICAKHEECKGCPMINGKVINTSSGQIRCDTGVNKEKFN